MLNKIYNSEFNSKEGDNKFESGLNRLTKCLIKINEYLYENEEDSNKKEYIELINKSSKTFDEYFQNCYKNNYETLYESKVININNLIKAIFNFDEKNYTNSKGEKIYIGIMPYNKQFGITLHSNYLNFLDKIYELYTKNYEFLNNIIKKSTKAIYHTKIAKLKERIEIRYNELSTKTFVNVQEVNIEVLHIFTEFKEVYENFLDEYKDNLKELLLIQNSISKNKNLFNNATQVRIISNEYNKFLSNALYFKYLAITYKKLVLLMFYDYRNKNPGLSAFTDIKLNTLKKLFKKAEEKILKINKEALKSNIQNKLKNYLENPLKLNSTNLEINRLVKKSKINKKNSIQEKLNKINKELENHEENNDNDNIQLNKKFTKKLKKLTENNNSDNIPIKIKNKVKKVDFWKNYKEEYLDGKTMYVVFIKKHSGKKISYGLFNIYDAILKGSILKSQFILSSKMDSDFFKKVELNSVINVGIKSDNIHHWSSVNMDYFKKLQKFNGHQLRLEFYKILSSKTNYNKVFNNDIKNSKIEKILLDYCNKYYFEKSCDLIIDQNIFIKNLNKLLK